MLKVLSNILLAMDSGNPAVLTMLDLSAAFDLLYVATRVRGYPDLRPLSARKYRRSVSEGVELR